MYFPLVRAASKMVWPAVASTYSPSILTEILSGMVEMILLAAWEGGQFCPGVPLRGTAFSRLWPPKKAAAAKIGRPTAGITLIEVVIAVTLLSMLSVGMLATIRMGFDGLHKTNSRLMENRRVAGAQRLLEQQLGGFMPVKA